MKRGEIYVADLGCNIGSEQDGIRPVLIIQNDKGNEFSGTVVIACLTKRHKKKYMPTHVELPQNIGLSFDSVVMLEQVRTIDKRRLKEFMCCLPQGYIEKVDKALKVSLGIKEEKKNMEQLQIFKNEEFGSIRTIEENGKVLFCGSDVAKALGYSNKTDALLKHCRYIAKHDVPHPQSKTKTIEMIFITEGDLYRLITHSKLPSAERFESWVFDEVLPAIRKTGSYQLPMNPMEQIKMIAGGVLQMDERLTKLENTMTLDYAQQQSITKAVNKAVTKVLGGKGSNAYQEVGKKVFAECNRDIKDFFCVNARNNIPKARFQDAMEYIGKWTPSTNTKLLINECNAQMCM